MCRPVLVLGAFAVLFVATAYSQQFKIIHPIYRPPPRPRYPTIRIAREAGNEVLKPDREGMYELHTEKQGFYNDVKIDPSRRNPRSLSTPSRGRASGSSSRGSRGHDTGPTHPGYNRRNARESGNEPPRMKTRMFQLPTERSIIYDDIKIDPSRRYARSLSTPGRGRASGNSRSNRGHDTGPTHPRYNRRNAREVGEGTDFVRWPSTKDRSSQSTYTDVNLDPSVSQPVNLDVHESDFLDLHPVQHRHTRSLYLPTLLPPSNPKPRWPPSFPIPTPQKRFPIYV